MYMTIHLCWDKQQMDSDRLCNKGKGSGCLTATELTIDRHVSKELSIPQPDWHETFVTAVLRCKLVSAVMSFQVL